MSQIQHDPTTSTRHRGRSRLGVAALAVLTAVGVAAAPRLIEPAGASVPAGSPIGKAEHIRISPGGLRFSGWAYDPGTSAPITVYLTVDGKKSSGRGTVVTASRSRPDLASRYPAARQHGFATSALLPAGKHRICVWAQNAKGTRGADRQLRCTTRDLIYGPIGHVQNLKTLPGRIYASGWAVDSDALTTPLTVDVIVDGKTTKTTASRSDSGALKSYAAAGTRHGYAVSIPASQGKHSVCVVVVDIGYGSNRRLHCGTLTLAESPVGKIDTLARSGKVIRLAGWTYDPDAPTTSLKVTLTIDGKLSTITANGVRTDVASAHRGVGSRHGFDLSLALAEGTHRICVTALNLSYGSNTALDCRTVALNFTPSAAVTGLTATTTGAALSGWATDPDTTKPIKARVSVDGATASTVTANAKSSSHSGHAFSLALPMPSGKHSICVTGLNVYYGTHNSAAACGTITLALSPLGHFDSLARAKGSTNLVATGWMFDPDTTASRYVSFTLDGAIATAHKTTVPRTDVARIYPSAGTAPHGFAQTFSADDGEHTVCATALNVSGGSNRNLGCKLINAVHPVAPSAVQQVSALAGYGGAVVSWSAPASDGGAPWTSYTVRSSDGRTVTAAATATSATITGLKPKTSYRFSVTATNVAGTSTPVTSASATTAANPPAQKTPAPVSTSRYIRNVSSATSTDLARMRSMGAADAKANPSGHGYLILLDIGGQDQYDGGVVLSATTHYVSYANLVKDVNAYVDGYAGAQRVSAPVTIAIGTNNDMDVSYTSGKAWANSVIDPAAAHASKYVNVVIAGANDIEPGFRATYTQTESWLTGYLGATSAPFIFNGSADGCAWTVTNRSCNNGWTMAGLYYLAGGAAPTRTLNLPQIYNTTMAAQWKYISLTGVGQNKPRINFGGPLTEWTACDQSNSCGSLTGRTAWSEMWRNLQSDPRLQVSSLPYSTDLRIN